MPIKDNNSIDDITLIYMKERGKVVRDNERLIRILNEVVANQNDSTVLTVKESTKLASNVEQRKDSYPAGIETEESHKVDKQYKTSGRCSSLQFNKTNKNRTDYQISSQNEEENNKRKKQ